MRRFSALALLAIACGQPGGGDADLTGPATATLADPTVDAPLAHEVRVASSAGEYTLDLVRNDRLFADGYRATVVEPGGVVRELPFAETPAARPCYYLGTVRDPSHLHGLVAYLASINAELIAITPINPVISTTTTRSTS